MLSTRFIDHKFIKAFLFNFLWINASEIFRYFVFIMPMMREAFPQIDTIAAMSWPIFLIWGVWDIILIIVVCLFTKLYMNYFGYHIKQALQAGTLVWVAVFGLLWLGLLNMGLATLPILAIAWPLSWLEMVVAALIMWHFNQDCKRGMS